MRQLLLFPTTTTALFISITISAQSNFLTNGEVFDYDVGDVIQSQQLLEVFGSGVASQAFTTQDSIISIAYNVNGMQVEYTSIRSQFVPNIPGPWFPLDTSFIHTFGYADSSATLTHVDLTGTCMYYVPIVDTVRAQAMYCGRNEWYRFYHHCDTCTCLEIWSPWSSRFVAGVGGPYWWRIPINVPNDHQIQHELTFFRKNGVECGTQVAMGVPGPERTQRVVKVSPNPASDIVMWTNEGDFDRIILTDAKGRILKQSDAADHMNVGDLASGLYLILFEGPFKTGSASFIKEER